VSALSPSTIGASPRELHDISRLRYAHDGGIVLQRLSGGTPTTPARGK
jgi:hypothetical protein